MLKRIFLLIFSVLTCSISDAQVTFPTNGAPFKVHTLYAFTNANIYTDHENLIKNATLLFKDGKIIQVGTNISIPTEAVITDLKGKYIYPSFIDIYSEYGVPDNKYPPKTAPGPQMQSNIKGAYGWNMAIKADYDAFKTFKHNPKQAQELKTNGFGVVSACPKDGIVRGSGVLANLNVSSKENNSIIKDKIAGYYGLFKGSSPQDYPNSLTGGIALLRQTYYDADWYKNSDKEEFNISLEAFNQLRSLPAIMEANDKYNALRISKIGKEFGVKFIVKAGGNEYQRINEIKETGLNYILPLNFPLALDVEDPYEAENIPLATLLHWEMAACNPAAFEKNDIPFCFTLSDLQNKKDFLPNLRKAIKYGLSEKTALKALFTNPAQFIQMSGKIGALKPGYYSNFFIANKSIFEEDCSILLHAVNGEIELYHELDPADIRGDYQLKLSDKTFNFRFTGDPIKPSASFKVDTANKKINYQFLNNILTFSLQEDSSSNKRLSGTYNASLKKFTGRGQDEKGNWFDFELSFTSNDTSKVKSKNKVEKINIGKVLYPFNAFGLTEEERKESVQTVLFKSATVWTNVHDSALQTTDVLVDGGKIVEIGKNLDVSKYKNIKIIDANGKHLTPGIIDEHSHIALSNGVNEGTEASSAEVRMGNVINADDINIYRQLSGGVTTAQLLHGSANPIGGQSGIIKLRWGASPEEMKFEGADEFIKFALGENVKQSNWGDFSSVRFPQTRMGVEQVYMDFFTRAKAYDLEWKNYTPNTKGKNNIVAPRRDLELEALAQIINKKRFITCHSYVQSEINMLMHVADSFGFKVNTFTHILEGYKVADKMKAHGVHASTFSDWWAYKNEVMEAIPYNAAILTKMGVVTAINSDDAEMGRRLNQEAAKAIKYGGLTEVEALKLVTLNPAIMLHLDSKVGSIQIGKTADLVLWTNNPLSIYAKVDKTLIDGKIYFDRETDLKQQEKVKQERARIISLLLKEKQGGAKTVKPRMRRPRLYHCNTIEGISEEETGHR
ncbi:MAG: amidohydrolase family protein [Sphingobacteriaceae bacterium]|nr:amidohydrolase family protein [Sphingobacteriaceae bacterium]